MHLIHKRLSVSQVSFLTLVFLCEPFILLSWHLYTLLLSPYEIWGKYKLEVIIFIFTFFFFSPRKLSLLVFACGHPNSRPSCWNLVSLFIKCVRLGWCWFPHSRSGQARLKLLTYSLHLSPMHLNLQGWIDTKESLNKCKLIFPQV